MILKKVCALISVGMLLVGSTALGFAAEADTAKETTAPVVRAIGGLEFTGPVVKLSLEEAEKAATTTGASFTAAELKKKSDEASARSNSESASNMKEANEESEGGSDYSKRQIEQAQKARDYYTTMASRNYEAAMNKITYDIQNAYYSMLHAEESVRIAEESLTVQETLLRTTEKKFELGMASKQDVLQMEISQNNAKSSLESAQLQLAEKKMDLNAELGYDQMQEVQLTSELQMAEASTLTLAQGLADARNNRNELYKAAYNIYTAEQNWNEYKIYPTNSAKYLTAYNGYQSALKSYNDTETSIAKEVRIAYANQRSAENQVATAKLSAGKAEESYNIYLAKYELGMVTLAEVQNAQIEKSNGAQSYANAILKYNLAVLDYEQAATVGSSSN